MFSFQSARAISKLFEPKSKGYNGLNRIDLTDLSVLKVLELSNSGGALFKSNVKLYECTTPKLSAVVCFHLGS